jgi:hypothetical protein
MAETPTQPTKSPEDERPEPQPSRASKAARFGLGAYQQVAAVFAAFGMAAIVHRLGVDWRGVLEPILNFWGLTVRPVMAFVFHVTLTVPFGWLGWHVELTQDTQDYISLAVMLTVSTYRAGLWAPNPNRPAPSFSDRIWSFVIVFVILLFFWYWLVLFLVYVVLFSDEKHRRDAALALSPFIYLSVILAVNFWVMPHVA